MVNPLSSGSYRPIIFILFVSNETLSITLIYSVEIFFSIIVFGWLYSLPYSIIKF